MLDPLYVDGQQKVGCHVISCQFFGRDHLSHRMHECRKREKKKGGRRCEPSQKAPIARRKVFRFIHSVRVSIGDSVKRYKSSVICWLHKNRSMIVLLLYGSSDLLLHRVARGHDEMQNA